MIQQYRAYLVGENGVFQSAEAFEAESDADALTAAQRYTRRGDIEVWQLGRKVGLLKGAGRSPQPTPPQRREPVVRQ
jgi:hypothetical protein